MNQNNKNGSNRKIFKELITTFFHEPQRQSLGQPFYNLLQNIRMGKIDNTIWNILLQKYYETIELNTTFNTTHIVGYRENANLINKLICTMTPVQKNKFIIFECIDTINNQI
ncbi:21684_t:CDS:2 [Gigaspora margarita]|uniref:21684_t:CDS:1 n=1 Tax=Gigaspora margarita TaxID=4874 RepID=A0ABM8VYN8_GIGMA|nr:21684_t:CDS:2 [Gigaspora margarita]